MQDLAALISKLAEALFFVMADEGCFLQVYDLHSALAHKAVHLMLL